MDDSSAPTLVSSQKEAQRAYQASKDRPHVGRVYDFLLGGSTNYAADREFARKAIRDTPDFPWLARQNRACLRRVVRHMLSLGVRQFVDLGSGLPTEGNVHEIADQEAMGECRVVYVDNDPIAGAHSYMLLSEEGVLDRHRPVTAEVLDAPVLWQAIVDNKLIDPEKPVGLLCFALLHFVRADPHEAVRYYRDHLAPGSLFGISHASYDELPEDGRADLEAAIENYKRTTGEPNARPRSEIAELLGVNDGWELLKPGICWTADWRTDGATQHSSGGDMESWRSLIVAGLSRKL
jgi:hypothetical protein